MTKDDAIKQADNYKLETNEDAYVVDCGGTYEWYSRIYFDNGFEGGFIVYGTDEMVDEI